MSAGGPKRDVAEDILFVLDSPKPQHLTFGVGQKYSGIVLDARGESIDAIATRFDGSQERILFVDGRSEDLGNHLPNLPNASRCRFVGELSAPVGSNCLSFEAIFSTGRRELVALYDLGDARRSQPRLRRSAAIVEEMPSPPPEIVRLTQGHDDAEAYRDSIVPGVANLITYFRESDIDLSRVRALLDFGCGSGRLLQGLAAEELGWSLSGCDVNDALTRWAREVLPAAVDVRRTSHSPPLPYSSGSFDLVTAVSVFTHLGRERQAEWARELARLLRPGGALLVTLHGLTYVTLFAPHRSREFEDNGGFEISTLMEGSNDFAAFHSLAGARSLFGAFALSGFFPAGRIQGRRRLFPVAAFQDVYVFVRQ